MAKPTPEAWAKARALFELGKSYRDISKVLKIPVTTLSDRAKLETWKKGELVQLIADGVRVEATIRTLETEQQDTVREAVSKQLEGLEFYATNARKVAKMGMVALSKDNTPANSKVVMEMMKTSMIVEGIVPFYPNAIINNTNAQQNIIEPVHFTRAPD